MHALARQQEDHYGLGAGADIRIYEGEKAQVRLFVAGRYLFGEKASYVIPSSVEIDGTTTRLQRARTGTDLIATQLGFTSLSPDSQVLSITQA